ncbi:putative general stress protein [Escherichia coli]|uniref:Putative general stress protein n=1 Tax=Escherichia coli TaxID=562 RepID=A0A377BYX3_ECOLX|nr:putative general stress protein [Escherichia coli]
MTIDKSIDEVTPAEFDALLLPGAIHRIICVGTTVLSPLPVIL